LRQQPHRAAQRNKARTHLANGTAIVLAEVGNRLVIGHEPARKPHHLDVVPSLTLQPPARLNPVEIAINIELQQHRRMIRRPPGCLRSYPVKSQLAQVEFLDKYLDHPNRIALANPVFQAFRKQCALPAIRALNEALHRIPPQIAQESYRENQMRHCVFTQARSQADMARLVCEVCFTPESGLAVGGFCTSALALEPTSHLHFMQ